MQIEFLNEECIRKWCARLEIPQGAANTLVEIAAKINADPELLAIFTDLHEKTAIRDEWHTEWAALPMDERVTAKLGKRDNLFYFLAYLAVLPYTEEQYRQIGISSDIFDATIQDVIQYFIKNSEKHGDWHLELFQWVWRHFSARLFRLGRLQYMLVPYEGHATAFRQKDCGKVMMLCGDGTELREDGWAFGAGKRKAEGKEQEKEPESPEPQAHRVAKFEETPEGWRGTPIHPRGYALEGEVFLPKTEWDLILQKGDTVVDMHIPSGKKDLTVEAMRASLRQAADFFETRSSPRWPAKPIKAWFCHTWFFTPQLQELLPPTSAIVNFQREFYLYPNAGGPEFLWNFVFGNEVKDPAQAPRDTSLRRAVLEWLENGKELFDMPGVMFHAPEDWGTQPYYK
jgi:hypothetical protein